MVSEKEPPPIVPNAETIEAMEAARRGELSGPFNTVEELLADLNSEDEADDLDVL
jgi:hypothetical protein